MFAPPSKSCRFSHPPSPCARSMAQGVSLSADSDSEGYSPSKNTSPAALSWSSLTGQLFPNLFAFPRCQTTAKKAEPFLQFDLLLFVFVFRKLIPTPQIALQTKQFCLGNSSCGISIIHFVLYCTWLLMLRYHFVSTFDNELCNLWRQCVPGGLLLIWYYSAGWGGCQGGLNKLFDYYIRESMVKNCICNI